MGQSFSSLPSVRLSQALPGLNLEERGAYGVEKLSADKYYRELSAFGSKAKVTLLHAAPAEAILIGRCPFLIGWWLGPLSIKSSEYDMCFGVMVKLFLFGGTFWVLKDLFLYTHIAHVPGDLSPVVFLIWGTMFIFSLWRFIPETSSVYLLLLLRGPLQPCGDLPCTGCWTAPHRFSCGPGYCGIHREHLQTPCWPWPIQRSLLTAPAELLVTHWCSLFTLVSPGFQRTLCVSKGWLPGLDEKAKPFFFSWNHHP